MNYLDHEIRKISIQVSDGIGRVSGLVTRPPKAKAAYVFAHGAGAGMEHSFMESVAGNLAREGIATLRFQFPYMEAGRKAPNPPKVLTATVGAAYSAARDEFTSLPLFAGGKSLGGRMTSTLVARAKPDGLRGIVFFGFPLHAPGKPSSHRADHLGAIDVPMLFVQGTRDRLADSKLLEEALQRTEADATIVMVDGGDHSLRVPKRTGRDNAEVLADVASRVATWIHKQS